VTNRTNRTNHGPHPIRALLRAEGRSVAWLARSIGRDPNYTLSVLHGLFPAAPGFRARCAAVMQRPEAELFDEHGGSTTPPKEGESFRDGAAVRAGYATGAGLSIVEEAPHTKTA
jgi:hypothetical protein